jgi:CheY-like chemotaxis protein
MPASRSILIVEDEPLIAMMLEDFLESLGHSTSSSAHLTVSQVAEIEWPSDSRKSSSIMAISGSSSTIRMERDAGMPRFA